MLCRMLKSDRVVAAILVPIMFTLSSSGCAKEGKQPRTASIDVALDLYAEGDTKNAISVLEAIESSGITGREADRAALVFGNILISERRHAEAIPRLQRAAEGIVAPDYASVLLMRAIVDGGLTESFAEAQTRAESLLSNRGSPATALVRRTAGYYLVRAASLRNEPATAAAAGASYLRDWPDAPHAQLDEVRWLTAEARRAAGDRQGSHELYSDIWFDTPSSSWAKEAQARMIELEKTHGFPRRLLTNQQLFELAQSLQNAGLHAEALDALETYLARRDVDSAAALHLKAKSQHDLRRNDACVATAWRLRREHQSSRHTRDGAMWAVKALRRKEDTAAIRDWVEWLNRTHPGTARATEALYNLGVYLQNVVDEKQGTQVLEAFVRDKPGSDLAPDALWKIAWSRRRLGDTAGALSTLDQMLTVHPKSGFRKAALYWKARLQESSSRESSLALYQMLLQEFPHDYYGHQAMRNIVSIGGKPGPVGNGQRFPVMNPLDGSGLYAANESYMMAANLKKIGLYEFAAEELATLPTADGDLGLQFALAELYSRSGRTWEAARIIAKHFKEFSTAGSTDTSLVPMRFWHICYPYNYRAIIRGTIQKEGLDKASIEPALVGALIRLESRFKPDAISPVGAIGLMQLMPATAERIAKERGLPSPTRADLFDPETNIRYGLYFLSQRVKEFGGDWFPAICSYNAGEQVVREWWNKKPAGQPIDEFIESIPYVDTRLYIKQVLGDYRNYERIYKEVS